MADTAPEPSRSPPEPKAGEAMGSSGKPAPYKAPGTERGLQKGEKGFADQGDKKLEYNPKVNANPTYDNWDKDQTNTWPKGGKSQTEDFIDRTRDMSLPQFAKHMIDNVRPSHEVPTMFATREGHYRPNPYDAIRYVTHLALENGAVLESLVMEFVRRDGLSGLMNELFKHRKAYEEAVNLMDVDRFANTVREMTAPPASETEGGEDEEKPASSGKKKSMGRPAKGRQAKSVDGGQLDMADSGVVGTTGKMRMKKK